MIDNGNSGDVCLDGSHAEVRLRALRRHFRASHREPEPFASPDLFLLGVIVFLTVFCVGVFGL